MTPDSAQPMMPRAARVRQGLMSNAFGLAARIFIQFAQVPLFLNFWSAEKYGEWLLLSAIPIYLALSGFGISAVGGNLIATAASLKQTERARSIFRTVWILVVTSNIFLLLVTVVALFGFGLHKAAHFSSLSPNELSQTILLLVLLVVLRLQTGINEVAFRARGAYGAFTFVDTIAQFVELAALVVCLSNFPSMVATAGTLVLVRAVLLLGLLIHLWSIDRWLLGKGDTSIAALAGEMMAPAAGQLIFPIAHAIQYQGITILIGSAFGAVEVATYVTLRTFLRFGDLFLNFFHNLSQNEVAYFASEVHQNRLKDFLALGLVCCVTAIGLYASAMIAAGPQLFGLWVSGQLRFDRGLLYVLLSITLLRALYGAPAAVLSGLNQTFAMSMAFLGGTILALGSGYLVSRFTVNLPVVLAWASLGELALLIAAWWYALSALGLNFASWLRMSLLSGDVFRDLRRKIADRWSTVR
jgi:O-antigen/teichoic acid export membrane protein